MSNTSKRTEKIQVLLAPEEVEQIDEWMFNNRIPSRAAAIRELVGRSIGTETVATEGRVRSREIGVLDSKIIRTGKPSFSVADATAPDFPLIYTSPGFTDLCEYSSDEVIGRNCRFLQGESTDREKTTKIRQALENAQTVEQEIVNYRKSGSAYMVRVLIEPVLDKPDGRPLLFIGTQTFLGDL